MPNLTQLRMAAREIFDEALRAADAEEAVRRAISLDESELRVCEETLALGTRRVYSIAIGKAAFGMARGLDETLGPRLAPGVITAPGYDAARRDAARPDVRKHALRNSWQIFQGGHPEPNEQSLAAAQAAFDLLKQANEERALIIFLISGGGSAMIEWPVNEEISLKDLRTANKALVGCGASISEINAVRRGFSAVKGGRLAARAPQCDQITLIVSDVPAGEERNVASGPSVAPSLDAPKTLEVIARYNLGAQLAPSILQALNTESKPVSDPNGLHRHFVLLDNQSALDAAAASAQRIGLTTEIAGDISDQPIAEGCAQLLGRLNSLRERARTRAASQTDAVCLISGGEFACPVTGDGLGGRNLETALRLGSLRNSSLPDSGLFVAVCAGTDGIDGNSPAAGAIVDTTTIARAGATDLDASDFIERSDAYSFFVALGDAIATGATGTNVRDIRILLASLE